MVAVWGWGVSLSAQFVAFNEHLGGGFTHSNTTLYSVNPPSATNAGVLRNLTNGASTRVTLTVTNTASLSVGSTSGVPNAGSPAETLFGGRVTFGNGCVNLGTNQTVAHVLSGLDSNKLYRLRGTTVRGNATSTFPNRWALFELAGALAFTPQHSAGCMTNGRPGLNLASNQVAMATGDNRAGELLAWDGIVPDSSGVVVVYSRRFYGTNVPGVITNDWAGSACALEALQLEEDAASPPWISVPPRDCRVWPGDPASLVAGAGGTPPLTYQWFKGLNPSNALAEATNALYAIASAVVADTGYYTLVVSNPFGAISSRMALLTVLTNPPVFTSVLTNVTVFYDGPAVFTAWVAGSEPISFQWYKDDAVIAGATNRLYSLTRALVEDAGKYMVVAANRLGMVSASATLTVLDTPLVITNQPRSQAGLVGSNLTLTVGIAGPNPGFQWFRDGQPLPEATNATLTLSGLTPTHAGGYRVVVANSVSSVTSVVARLTVVPPPGLDSFDARANGTVWCLAIQPDGKILVGGDFIGLGGANRTYLGRLNADGSPDTSLTVSANTASVLALAVQPDGKVLVGGSFTALGNEPRTRLGRLNPDGSVDAAFNPGANNHVWALLLQADGKVVVAGDFTSLGGVARNRIGRLHSDGSVDAGFNPGADAVVYSLAAQADGKILVGGSFTSLGGQARSRLGRLNAGGTLDVSFNPGANSTVRCLGVQADAKVLVGGDFGTLGGQTRTRLGRLLPDGSVEGLFKPAADDSIYTMALQSDGKIVVGGLFTNLGGLPRSFLGRLNPDGAVDGTFNVGASNSVRALGLQADGKVLVGGNFTTLAGQPRGCLGRLSNTEPPTQQVERQGAILSWWRGGTGPEVGRVTFETAAPEETGWTSAGAGVRVSGGWQCEGGDLAPNTSVRVRGFVSGGVGNSSSWFVETIFNPPYVAGTPQSLRTNLGALIILTAPLAGATPISCRWQKDGVDLEESERCVGTRSNILVISDARGTDAGLYSVVLSNPFGQGSGLVAQVAVIDPCITALRVDGEVFLGSNWVADVTVAGAGPLGYQWYKDGVALAGGDGATLTRSNVQMADAGDYWVVVSNPSGSDTSRVARLTVLMPVLPDSLDPRPGGLVNALAFQADGKLLVGGGFPSLGGQPRQSLGRLTPDGTLDPHFNPGPSGVVCGLLVQPNGQIVIGGSFTSVSGQLRNRIARLNSDGSLDPAFTPPIDSYVNCLALQANGGILLGSDGYLVSWMPVTPMARLKPNGVVDAAFDPQVGGPVSCIVVQPDGKILVGGAFWNVAGRSRPALCRLNEDGSLDTSFDARASQRVLCLAVQPDGKILVGGSFTSFGGQARSGLARLQPDGSLDLSFVTEASSTVSSLALQTDGKILLAGSFTTLGGQPRLNLGRLCPDGSVDGSFNPSADGIVRALAVQTDGSVVMGGDFRTVGGQSRPGLARLNNTLAGTQDWRWEGADLKWQLGGSSPEFWRVSFELTPDGGSTWAELSPVTRVNGGWRYTGLGPLAKATVRARGFIVGGSQSASAWFVESFLGAPAVVSPPQEVTTNAGARLVLSADVRGRSPLFYRWQKDGLDLLEGEGLTGTESNVLVLASVKSNDQGSYGLVVSNVDGVVQVLIANLTVRDPLLVSQPASQVAWLGTNVVFAATAGGTPPVAYQWLKGGVAIAGATAASLTITNVSWADDGSVYTLQVSNAWGTDLSAAALLRVIRPPGADGFNPSPNNTVYCLAEQGAGRILVAGEFTTLGGTPRAGLGRVQADGSLDLSFNPGAEPASVLALTVQADGGMLVGGGFSFLGGQPRNRLGRLTAEGAVDGTFNPGADGLIRTLWIQEDGRILVGGDFTTLAGQARNRIGRLYADGRLDPTFNPGASGPVYALAVQNGRILVGGSFSSLAGQGRPNLGRLLADGSLDASFNPTPAGTVRCLSGRPDGSVLVGGDFAAMGGVPCGRVARLFSDGGYDGTFLRAGSGSVCTMVVQADGRVLVGGSFTWLGDQLRNRLGRLNSDGSPDPTFAPQADGTVWALGLQEDGSIVVGGAFSTVGGTRRTRLARLTNTHPATVNLTVEGPTATWRRAGTCPEVTAALFGASTNGGASWVELGPGVAGAGGWQCSNLGDWPGAAVRARGWVAGANDNASRWLVETRTGAPTVQLQALTLLTNVGATVVLRAEADGAAPFAWQWQHDGVDLPTGGRLLGAQSNVLVIQNARITDTGRYTVRVSNSSGSASGLAAQVTIVDPFILSPPAAWFGNPGSNAVFRVQALGSAPLSYQWYRNGLPVPGATAATLTLPNLLLGDHGSLFSVVVSNSFGCVTSLSAALTVVWPVVPDSANPNPNGTVYALAAQTDGKTLLGGSFSVLGGQSRASLGRLLPDGSLDAAFAIPVGGTVYCLALLPDGAALLGGDFGQVGGQNRNRIARLNADGSLDATFDPGANGTVYALGVQPDGKILLAGSFTSLAGQSRSYLGRVNRDGSLDTAFNVACNSYVYALALQPDGKILVGGGFSTLNSQPHNGLGRLHSNGNLDTSFTTEADAAVYALVVQPDGKILAGGDFSILGGRVRTRLGRLLPDGTTEGTFNPGADNTVYSLALQADGKTLAGGAFLTLGGQSRARLGRIEATGTIDATFNPGANGTVHALGLEADGQILAGGDFAILGGAERIRFGRLSNTLGASQGLTWDGATARWLRGGAGPEVAWTTFALSTNGGTTWTDLGTGRRVPGGWEFSSASLPPQPTIRARGWVTGGRGNGSSWPAESTVIFRNGPRFGTSSNLRVSNGVIHLHLLDVPTPGSIVLETSSDLRGEWTPLLTNSAPTAVLEWTNVVQTNWPQRFYRALWQQP